MTTPNIVPAKYTGIAQPWLIAKIDRSGAQRMEAQVIAIPNATAVGQIVGLVPFRGGAEYDYGSTIITDALGAGVTVSIGYVYNDNVTFTNNTAAFQTATAANTANLIQAPNVPANVAWKAPINADGWIVAVIGGAATAAAGNISCQIVLSYDQQ